MQIIGPDGVTKEYTDGTTLAQIAKDYQNRFSSPIAVGFLDGRATPLPLAPQGGEHVNFLDLNSPEGYSTYISTFLFTLIAAMRQMRPEVWLEVQNTFGNALYCDIKNRIVLSKYDLADITKCMQDMIDKDMPVEVIVKKKAEAWPYIHPKFYQDQAPLLSALPEDSTVNVYQLDGVRAYFVQPLLPSLGYLKKFELKSMGSGLLLRYGKQGSYDQLEPFRERKKLAAVYAESEKMGQRMHCPTVAALNQFIERGDSRGIIQMCEAQHEKRIAQIADIIASEDEGVRLVLIAGPSSSGKTTFSQRLAVQLRVNGLRPIPISMDNYFKERKDTPKLPDGSYDFESIDALDVDLFNSQLEKLLKGEMVEIPHFSFKSGERSYRGQKEQLGNDGVVIAEGIHGLNEVVSASVPKDQKLKLYISALTPLSFDDYNRIPTTDMRLLRRMVRDSKFRSHDPLMTIRNWHKVREGEEKYIFPFSEEADIMFNTTLIYELAVFKKYAYPLLESIPHSEPEFVVARKLMDMLNVVQSIDDEAIPNNSIMREFIGNSIFGDLL
ncbi:MAG: nucleoside kinase [Acidaminococcus sp.]|jgi:uridine kinase|nr:nucleoside kinase [Acidaminococcus sp.]